MFPLIKHIDDLRPFIEHKKEINFIPGFNGSTIVCYQFQDSDTFDTPHACEARGIVFDRNGNVAARPLHKFFNLGERPGTQPDITRAVRVMDKLDGSMIHTVWLDGELFLKSKKCFSNSQTDMAKEWLTRPANAGVLRMCTEFASQGLTVIFELTSPSNRIVVSYPATQLSLLHVRDNKTGKYLDKAALEGLSHVFKVALVAEYPDAAAAIESLPAMVGREGYVVQMANGDMVKAKAPWYLQLHRTVSFTRERDIAEAALEERLDDIKAALAELGHDLSAINAIETRVKETLVNTRKSVESAVKVSKAAEFDRKTFAVSFTGHPLFGLLMAAYQGKEPDYQGWYTRNVLKQEWSLDPVGGMPAAQELEG